MSVALTWLLEHNKAYKAKVHEQLQKLLPVAPKVTRP